jgi:hypothetical protein
MANSMPGMKRVQLRLEDEECGHQTSKMASFRLVFAVTNVNVKARCFVDVNSEAVLQEGTNFLDLVHRSWVEIVSGRIDFDSMPSIFEVLVGGLDTYILSNYPTRKPFVLGILKITSINFILRS